MNDPTLCRQNGAAVRRIRQQSGIKPRQLAALVDCHPGSLSNIENEQFQASVELLYRIARALDVPVADLLSEHGQAELSAVS